MTRARSSRTALAVALVAVAAAGGALLSAPSAVAAPSSDGAKEKTNQGATEAGLGYDRFIVHFEPGTAADSSDAAAQAELDEVGREAGHRLKVTRRLATSGALVQVESSLDKDKADRLLAKLVAKAGVAYAEPDVVMTATVEPNDTSYPSQWHYSEPLAGMRLPLAWETATGTGVTVAVLDTGITAHTDLDANVVGGYDFVSNGTLARDGGGRDASPADQGDWTTSGQCGFGSRASNSSWHGTHVAGTIAAATNNGAGVAGVAYGATVVPVRVLAACGGTLADIADAIVWASGGTVTGVPANTNPAKVINMSLGGSGTCGATYQNAITAAVGRGTTVVVAAGNSNANASGFQPASCSGTVVVAASDREGNRAQYSNYGATIDVTAPGGETAVAANGVLSTLNTGTTVPAQQAYAFYQGTSMATPHVAGLVALLQQGRTPLLTPVEVEARLKASARPLPGACAEGCGAGLVDAAATVSGSAPPPPPPPAPSLFTNDADVQISDNGTTAQSAIAVSGRTGNAPSALKVSVDITHPRRGDLQVDLQAPDGTVYRVKSPRKQETTPNLVATYTVNASSEVANGTWTLLVRDTRAGGSGTSQLNSWSLQF